MRTPQQNDLVRLKKTVAGDRYRHVTRVKAEIPGIEGGLELCDGLVDAGGNMSRGWNVRDLEVVRISTKSGRRRFVIAR